MSEKNKRFDKGVKAARFSSLVLLALSVLKGVVAVVSGSVALLADFTHSFVDVLSSVAVWVGLRLIQKKPTERFPYGYYRAESFALLIVSIVIVVSGFLIIVEAVDRLFKSTVILYPVAVLIVAAFSGAASYVLSIYKKRVGMSIGSQSLVSEGQHSIVDVYASLLVFIGVFFYYLGYPKGEALAGFAIGALIIRMGIPFGRDAILALMDASPDPKAVREMKEIAEGVPGVEEVHGVRLRKSGPVYFGEMHVILQRGISLEKSHEISEIIEERINKRLKNIESVTIHIGPFHEEKHGEKDAS